VKRTQLAFKRWQL